MVIKKLISKEKYGIKCPYEMNGEFYVIHNTGNDASAKNEIAYMSNNNKTVSFHYAVDDMEIIQAIEENRNAYHAGDGRNGRGNRKGIAVEICYSLSGGDRFIKAEERAARFIAEKLTEKGWGIDRVKKHQDFSNKYCPHRTLDMGWDRFLNMVNSYMSISTDNAPQGEFFEKYTGTGHSIADALKAIGEKGDFASRKEIAKINGMENYSGKAEENLKMLALLKEGRLIKVKGVQKQYFPKYTGASKSIVDALKSIGAPSDFAFRKTVAIKNGMENYSGKAEENLKMLSLLKEGRLIK